MVYILHIKQSYFVAVVTVLEDIRGNTINTENPVTDQTTHKVRSPQPILWLFYCSWWRHQMETLSMLVALPEGNPLVISAFPSQRTVMQNVDVFFELCQKKCLSKQSRHGDLRCHFAHYDVTVMEYQDGFSETIIATSLMLRQAWIDSVPVKQPWIIWVGNCTKQNPMYTLQTIKIICHGHIRK